VARDQLGLGSGGYGVLLGAVGVGAVFGAVVLARLRARGAATDTILVGASAAVALGALALAESHVVALVIAALAVAGVGWILVLATLNSTYQAMLPGWVKARALAYYLIVFQGGLAIGSAALGGLAGAVGVETVLLIAAGGLLVGPLITRLRPIPRIDPAELVPAADWPPAPALAEPVGGPIMVTVEHRAAAGSEAAMAEAVLGLRRVRRRTGATAWSAWRDTSDPNRVLEQFVVATWEEHERQHARMTERDRARVNAVRALAEPGSHARVVHWAHVAPARPSS